jgi:hypothetical protein
MESGLIIEAPPLPPNPAPLVGIPVDGLEQRVRRLEDAVAALQDTRQLEDRVAERVASRIQRQQPPPRETAEVLWTASRHLLPAAVALTQAPGHPARSAGAVWLPWELYAEIRAMFAMFFDRRFRVSWTARVVPIVMLTLMVFSWLLLGGIFLVGPFLDKATDVVLIIVIYKVLSREARRYLAALPSLGDPGG